MGSILPTAMVWSVMLFAAATAATAVARLAREAERVQQSWDDERRLRACGWTTAAVHNLEDAGHALAAMDPEGATAYERAADDAADMWRDRYADSDADTPLQDCVASSLAMAIEAHLQRHDGQAEVWPNWVPSFKGLDDRLQP